MMTNKFLILPFMLAFFLCAMIFPQKIFSQSVGNQNFPQGATRGTTEMNQNIRPIEIPNVDISITQPQTGRQFAFSLQVLLLLTILTLAPSILILATCFLRFSIVLDFIKRALSLQQVPPTAVLNGIALFMTLFVMWPTFSEIYQNAFKPLSSGQIEIEQAFNETRKPISIFMLRQIGDETGRKTLHFFMSRANLQKPNYENGGVLTIPLYVLIPSYILHELTVAFKIGVVLYIPFIIIDMVVASILMGMGMMMLPPVQISMPFKLMLFVLVDGWQLLTEQLFLSIGF